VPAIARRARQFDVVQAHGDVAALLALPVLRSRPSVWTPAGLHLLRRVQGTRARVVRAGLRQVIAASGRVVCSQTEADDLAPLAGRHRDKLLVVDNGVRLPPWPAPEERARARAELDLADDEVVALFLGQLEERKDPLTPLRATENVEGLTLLVAGDGPLRAELERHASASIRVLGHTDPKPLLRAADLFVMPSWREGQSLAVLEAMANGLAMVVSDGAGNPEAVGDAGVIVPVRDVGAWTRELARLVADAAERIRLQQAARRRAEGRFSAERFRRDFEAIYDAVAA
jgi:glycosyltransferase involved in cell wall biosynthesis